MNDGGRSGKDFWEKFSVISGFIAAVFVPLALGLAGHWYATAIKERETVLKEQEFARQWVQIALDILRDQETADHANLRSWAVNVINHYSDPAIHMQEELKNDLVAGQVRLPEPAQGSNRAQQVEALETTALNALLQQDLESAITAMDSAHDLWSDFRTVWEMLQLLEAERSLAGTADPAAWQALYRKLLAEMDLRGVAPDTLRRLREAAGS